jgi:hypothetical protein
LNRESRRQPGVVVSVKERASKASVVEGQTSREEQGEAKVEVNLESQEEVEVEQQAASMMVGVRPAKGLSRDLEG